MTTTITICDTCKRDDWDSNASHMTDGEALALLIENAAAGIDAVTTRRHSCLMGCSGGCNITLQAKGKMAYTLGRFEPTAEAAQGIVEYAAKHAGAQNGVVPFRDWPVAIKGHFVTRHPPLPE
ncbi:DUF1636 family protein [Jannaschia pohangensis]|uniref:Predicted metal-binding protein n=1 Tax=Jannaschia pohangensis TaxID=390807 RepID=A0A1I3M3L5_9RHOB|nr:DUF1636 domain-containing protein [Jannaschia pohangensis]SFI91614.1 Predicted metal-binding protein [Jannaschia pohangensis]